MTSKPVEHSSRSHALLSASGASRWLNCTPSARLEEGYGEKKSSVYAAEGTLAHELAELYIRFDTLKDISQGEYSERLCKIMSDELYSDEMQDALPMYTQYCHEQFMEALIFDENARIEIEQQLDLTKYVPESFGTADCVIIGNGRMEVIDLKYGKGVRVQAEWNKQLMLYALGALAKYNTYDITEVKVTIVQPRLDSISSWVVPKKDLIEWAETELKPKAKMAFAGEGELSSGEWCKFCAVRNRCRRLYEDQIKIARYEFKAPNLLTDEEVAYVVMCLPDLIEWASGITTYATEAAVNSDKHWPGLKLVEGISRRKWADEDTAGDIIKQRLPELSDEDLYTSKLNSITAIEKTVGKKRFTSLLSDLIIKPQGKPVLVKEDDKRPALGLEQARQDFKD